MNDIEKLIAYCKEVGSIEASMNVLGWDMETYMPKGSGEARSEVLGVLSKVQHQKVCSSEYGDLIAECKGDKSLNAAQRSLVAEIERDRNKSIKLPEDLVVEQSQVTSSAQQEWAKARHTNAPQDFLPWLDRVVIITKEVAACLQEGEQTQYDALMDGYERGATGAEIDKVFDALKNELVPLIAAIKEAGQPIENKLAECTFSIPIQKKLNNTLLDVIGFDTRFGRIDESEHPFTTNFHPTDVRLTTRYDEKNIIDSVFSTLHEGGHGLYEQGLPIATAHTPLSEAVSLGVHESQSRFWENCIGRSEIFWRVQYQKIQDAFGTEVSSISKEDFYTLINRVEPSFIRVDADEITYNMHIILRYEVEKALFNGDIGSGDIEALWNEKMQKYLGIVPSNPMEGFMQDVHWSAGLFGYFPTYSLGNMNAAQLFNTLKKETPDFESQMLSGNYTFINEWLKEKVWKHGRQFSPSELIKNATGESLNPEHFVSYLKEKYSGIYGL